MSTDDRLFFLVPDGHELRRAWNDAVTKQREFNAAMIAFRDAMGAKEVWTRDHVQFSGLRFAGNPPEGWRMDKRKGYCVPNLKSKAGREIRERVKALPRGTMSGWELSGIIGFSHWADDHVYFPVPEEIGDKLILSVHKDVPEKPTGCAPLKHSEYWALREAIA